MRKPAACNAGKPSGMPKLRKVASAAQNAALRDCSAVSQVGVSWFIEHAPQ
ncbi:hypothetical protein JCM10599A_65840 [Paraburkholderia kururiensis]